MRWEYTPLKGGPVTFGGAELAAALAAEGAGLTGLKLPYIKLGADGWRAVAGALRACPRLTKLILYRNGLGDAAFAALAEALGRGACPGMATLDAGGNGLTVLPEALCGVASLEELQLGGNDIGSLPHGLLHLTRLRRLDMHDNPRLAAEHDIVVVFPPGIAGDATRLRLASARRFDGGIVGETQHHRADDRTDEGLEEGGTHASHIAHVVPYIISNSSWI